MINKTGTGQAVLKESEVELFLCEVNSLLDTKDLTFTTVDRLYNIYKDNRNTIDTYEKSTKDLRNICNRLDYYKKVIDFIRIGDVSSIKMELAKADTFNLYGNHKDVLKMIVKDGDSEIIFLDNFNKLKSFEAIAKQYNGDGGGSRGYAEAINDALETSGEKVVNSDREQDKTEGTPVKIDKDRSNTQHRYTCDICGPNMWFKTKKGLIKHMGSKHNSSIGVTNTSFKCSECKSDKRFVTKEEYDKHMKAGMHER